jgi:hypothetical protein
MFQIFERPIAQKYVQRLAAFFDLRDDLRHDVGDRTKLDERRWVSRMGLSVGAASAVVAAVAAQAPAATGWAGDILAAAGLLANYATPVGFGLYGAAHLSAVRLASKMGHASLASVPMHPDGVESLSSLTAAFRNARNDERRLAILGQASLVIDRLASPDGLDVAEMLIEVDRKMGASHALGFVEALPEKVAHSIFVRATIKGIELRQSAEPLQEAESALHLSNF